MSVNKLPNSLFKFINLNKPEKDIQTIISGIFSESKLKITTPKYFNDRFDSRIILDKFHCSQILKEFDNLYPNNHKLNQSEIEFRALQLEASPILCLTANSPLDTSSDIMWGLYGGDGKGICIEFEYSKIFNIYRNILSLKFLRIY